MQMHRVLVNPRPPHPPIKYIFVLKDIFVIIYTCIYQHKIYNSYTTKGQRLAKP